MDIKDSYLHGTVGVVKSISVDADKLTYKLADKDNTSVDVTMPTATQSANGLLSSADKKKLDSITGKIKDSDIIWGTDGITGGISPIDNAASYLHSGNKLLFARPEGITIEYSTNGGSTWIDYGATDDQKIALVSGLYYNSYKIGKGLSTKVLSTDLLRITLHATNMNVYTVAKSLLIDLSTDGSNSCKVKLETATKGSPASFSVIGEYPVQGWSGWNRIPLNTITFGGGPTLTSHVEIIRLTFTTTGTAKETGGHAYIMALLLLGATNWTTPSNMAKTGHLYSWNSSLDAAFPALITATLFNGPATKLQTKRKLWGQNFDGTADVSGSLTGVSNLTASGQITAGVFYGKGSLGGAALYAGHREGLALGIEPYDKDGKWLNCGILLFQDGNVSIGTTSNYEKLYVNGNVKATSFIGNLDGTYVNKLTGYSKATTKGAIAATDTLNVALGKLEFKADAAYDLVKGAYDGDGTIENLAEILKVLEGIKDTETIQAIIGKYLPLAGGIMTGDVKWESGTGHNTRLPAHIYRNSYNNDGRVFDHYYHPGEKGYTNSIAELRVKSGDSYHTLRFGGDGAFTWMNHNVLHANNYTSYTVKKDGTGASGTWGINISGDAVGATKLTRSNYLTSDDAINNFLEANLFKFALFKTTEQNLIGMVYNDGMLLSIPWINTDYGFQLAFDDTTSVVMKGRGKANTWGNWYTFLHTGNSFVSGGGSSAGSAITVNIGGTSKTLTIPSSLPANGGTASSANWLNPNNKLEYGASGLNYFNINGTEGNDKSNCTPTSSWYHIIRMNHGNSDGYLVDIAAPVNGTSGIYWRQIAYGTFRGWYKILDSNNYNSYALPLTGGTLTGGLTISNDNWGSLLVLNRNNNGSNWGPAILFNIEGSNVGTLTMASDNLYIGNNGSIRYRAWHEGNDGSGSGLDADLLDGTHKADLFTSLTNVNTKANPYSLSATIGGTTRFLLVNSFRLAAQDIRHTTPTPNDVSDKSVTAWFNNEDTPGNAYWYSGITVAGWNNDYRVWLLASSSDQSDAETLLYFRTGRSDTWGSWRAVLDSSNTHIKSGVITINGTAITPLTQQSLANYVTLNTYLTITGGKAFANNIELVPYNDLSTFSLVFREKNAERKYLSCVNGDLKFGSSNDVKKIWHEGNDGSGSGLDADLLDGLHASAFVTLTGSLTITGQKNFNTNTNSAPLVLSRSGLNTKECVSIGVDDGTVVFNHIQDEKTANYTFKGTWLDKENSDGSKAGNHAVYFNLGNSDASIKLDTYTVYHTGNLTKLSQLENDSNFVTGGPYLPLAGGVMNDGAKITFNTNGGIIQTTATTSNATRLVQWYKGSSKDSDYTNAATIGWHNMGDTDGAIYLVPHPSNTEPWAGSVGLYIGKNTLKWNNNNLLHSGNSSVSGGGSTWGSSITVKINGTTKTLTIPAKPTDTKVTQTVTTSGNTSWRPIILGASYGATSSFTPSTVTDAVYASHLMQVKPDTGDLWIKGHITRSSGGSWIKARDNAVVKQICTTSSTYLPVVSMKTASGSWSMGTLGNSEKLIVSYDTDENYNANTNSNTAISFPTSGGTLALTSQIPSLTNYYTKTESDSRFYGATINRTANTVLAAPDGSAGVASFRKLVVADMPNGVFKHLGMENKASVWSWGTVSGTSGWNATASDRGYRGQYGTNLDISGYSTWYHRFAMCTDGRIEYWHGINTKTLTKLGTIAWTSDIPEIPNISITNSGSGNAVTSITASGHTLTVTKGSTFATSGHTHYYLTTPGDKSSEATTPSSYSNTFVFLGLKNNSAIDSPSSVTYSYLLGLRGWSDSSGGNSWELAFNNTGIYARNGASTWGSWGKIAFISDIPTKTSQLTNDSNFITSRGYIGTTPVLGSLAAQSLSGIVDIVATGNYTSAVSTSTSLYLKLANKDTAIGLRADSGTVRGVYDYGKSKWLVYSNGTDGTVLLGHNTTSTWSKSGEGTGEGIKILNAVNSSPTGTLSSYSIGLEVSGYYSLLLASKARVNDTLYFKGASSTGWVEILHKNNGISYDLNIDTDATDLRQAGYGYATKGWKGSGPAIAIGSTNGYTTLIQQLAGNPTLYVSYKSNGGDVQAWNQIAFISDLTWANITGKPTIPTIPSLSLGNTTGSGNAVTSISVSGHTITLNKGTTFSLSGHTHSYLPLAGGTLTGSLTVGNKDANELISIAGNTSQLKMMAWTNATYIESGNSGFTDNVPLHITGYNANLGSTLYLDFNTITCRGSYTNIDSGNWSNYITIPTVPTLYERNLGVNGTNWTFSSPYNTATTTIYAPTSAGTSGQVLVSTGGTPTWLTISTGGGYIGTTAVSSSSNAGQNITGIGSITPNATNISYLGTSSLYWKEVTANVFRSYGESGTWAAFYLNSSGTTVFENSSGAFYINSKGLISLKAATNLVVLGSGTAAFYPNTTLTLGTSSLRWNYVYATHLNAEGGSFYTDANGAYWTSDFRLKTNIIKARNLDVADLLVEFDWKESNEHSWGYIAQDLLEVLPEAVSYNADTDRYAVNYNVAHSAAIASLTARIKELEEKLKKYGIW